MGEKQKGRGPTVPSDDQMRMTKLSLEHPSDDATLQKKIKKVIETTRCSASQAEVALYDNDNDVARAVDYIFENNGKVDCWTEQKSRKTKKEEQEREEARRAQEAAVRVRIARGSGRRGGRDGPPAYRDNFRESRESFRENRESFRENKDNREVKEKDSNRENKEPREFGAQREGFSGRGGFRGGRGGGTRNGRGGSRPHQSDTLNQSSSSYDENDWKVGRLVFEASTTSSTSNAAPTPPAPPVGSSAGPMSFAAMAKKATIPPPPPPQPVVQRSPVKPVEPEPEHDLIYEEDVEPSPPEPSPSPVTPEPPSDLPDPVAADATVNETWTNDLKAELGIGRSDPPMPVVSLQQRVEFIESAGAAALSEFTFGFAPEPEPAVPVMAAPVQPSMPPPSIPAAIPQHIPSSYRSMPPATAVPPAHPSPPHMDRRQEREEPQKASPPSSYMPASSSRGGLSYDTNPSVAYHPSLNRAAPSATSQPPPQVPFGQQQSSVPPPSTMFPQMPPYASYPYMGMYSPVASGLRPDGTTDPYLSMAPYFGMGPLDLSTILPPSTLTSHSTQQQMQPRTTEHSDMNKYGGGGGVGGRTESVAPPPGFPATNAFVQPSLSSLLVQQQQHYTHPFSFMMPPVSGGRSLYEDDRRGGGGVGKTEVNRGQPTHHAQNTPPPLSAHSHYSHHANAPPSGMFSVPKNNQYSSNNKWSGNN